MNGIDGLSQALGEACRAKGAMVATAESCTGGGVGEAITRTPGSSAWFDRGFVTYTNEAKVDLLGVREETIGSHGAVSEAVAREMAVGALHQSRAEATVAVTGIAGPDGGTVKKPVGLVWFAWAHLDGRTVSRFELFGGDRAAIRARAVEVALEGLTAIVASAAEKAAPEPAVPEPDPA
jgi:nicotinamide-nucleotide amidase